MRGIWCFTFACLVFVINVKIVHVSIKCFRWFLKDATQRTRVEEEWMGGWLVGRPVDKSGLISNGRINIRKHKLPGLRHFLWHKQFNVLVACHSAAHPNVRTNTSIYPFICSSNCPSNGKGYNVDLSALSNSERKLYLTSS